MKTEKPPGSAGVTGIPSRENDGFQSVAGGFRHLRFLPLFKRKTQTVFDALKNKKKGLESHCLRGLIGRKHKKGGFGPFCVNRSFVCEIPQENRVIGNRYVKNPSKGIASLITGTSKHGVKPCRH